MVELLEDIIVINEERFTRMVLNKLDPSQIERYSQQAREYGVVFEFLRDAKQRRAVITFTYNKTTGNAAYHFNNKSYGGK